LHYKKLLEAHIVFYEVESRAFYYDEYMECKNWKSWTNSVSICEVLKLFGFILGWEPKFEGDPWKFKGIYGQISPRIEELRDTRIEDANFAKEELKGKIQDVFNKVANCTRKGDRYESTAASKIIHTILPDLFVMWDRKIRRGTLGDEERKSGVEYARNFLPFAQKELEKAITTCMTERKMKRDEAIKFIREQCAGKTLAKLADEYNYMKYTIRHPSFLNDN